MRLLFEDQDTGEQFVVESKKIRTRAEFMDILSRQRVVIKFIKKGDLRTGEGVGRLRIMYCTRNFDIIPKEHHPSGSYKGPRHVIPVFDLVKKAWRSFRIGSVKSVEPRKLGWIDRTFRQGKYKKDFNPRFRGYSSDVPDETQLLDHVVHHEEVARYTVDLETAVEIMRNDEIKASGIVPNYVSEEFVTRPYVSINEDFLGRDGSVTFYLDADRYTIESGRVLLDDGETGMSVSRGVNRVSIELPEDSTPTVISEIVSLCTAHGIDFDMPNLEMEAVVVPPDVTSFANFLTEKAKKAPMYVKRDVSQSSVDNIKKLAKSLGVESVVDDMHVTVCFSREDVDWGKAEADSNDITARVTGLKWLGDDSECLVLTLEPSDELIERHDYYRNLGASWDYDGYIPHVTLSYEAKDLDIDVDQDLDLVISLQPEDIEDLDLDWKDKVEEDDVQAD